MLGTATVFRVNSHSTQAAAQRSDAADGVCIRNPPRAQREHVFQMGSKTNGPWGYTVQM